MDDPLRVIDAAQWLAHPDARLQFDTWPPLPIWTLAAVLKLPFNDPILAAVAINTTAALACIPLAYAIARRLAINRLTSVLCAAVIAFEPVATWLSLSAMAESLEAALVLLSLLLWLIYVTTARSVWLLAAAAAFAMASAAKFECFPFAGVFLIFCLYRIWIFRQRPKDLAIVIAAMVISFSYVAAVMAWGGTSHHNFLYFSEPARLVFQHSPWLADTYKTVWSRILFYPNMLFSGWPILFPGMVISIFLFVWRHPERERAVWTSLFCLVPIAVLSAGAVGGGIPNGFGPGPRHVFVTWIVLIFPLAYAMTLVRTPAVTGSAPFAFLACVLLATDVPDTLDAPIVFPRYAEQLGRQVLLSDAVRKVAPNARVLVETRSTSSLTPDDDRNFDQDAYFFRMIAPLRVTMDPLNSGADPTLFAPRASRMEASVRQDNDRIVVAHSRAYVMALRTFMAPAAHFFDQTVFVWPGDTVLRTSLADAVRPRELFWLPVSYSRVLAHNGVLTLESREPRLLRNYPVSMGASSAEYEGAVPESDFVIVVDFDANAQPRPNANQFEETCVTIDAGVAKARLSFRQEPAHAFYALFGPSTESQLDAGTTTAGRLRLRRIGGRLTGEAWVGGAWRPVGAIAFPSGSPTYVRLETFSNGNKPLHASFSRFAIATVR